MKIRISDISPEGLAVSDSLSLEALNSRLKEGRESGIVFTEAPRIELKVFKTATGAETKGNVKSRYRQPCGLCNKEVDREVEVETNFILRRRPEGAPAFGEYEDDVGITHFEGDHVDLEEVIQEALILSLSLYWRPAENEQGECMVCGVSTCSNKVSDSEGGKNTLGNLMKKAGLN